MNVCQNLGLVGVQCCCVSPGIHRAQLCDCRQCFKALWYLGASENTTKGAYVNWPLYEWEACLKIPVAASQKNIPPLWSWRAERTLSTTSNRACLCTWSSVAGELLGHRLTSSPALYTQAQCGCVVSQVLLCYCANMSPAFLVGGWMQEWTFIMDGWRGGHPSYMEGWLSILEGRILTGADSKGSIGHTKQAITYLLPCQRHPISVGVRGCEVHLAFKILELLRTCLDLRKPTTQMDNVYPRHFSSSPPSLLSYSLLAGKIWDCERKRVDKWQRQRETEGRNEWHDNVFWTCF